ncbi:MAG TPA: superoxide dismutase family protein [Gemmatimonadales bacterium]|nr:superoxide dismutase family protein [Gemmatimonadales bacterium]
MHSMLKHTVALAAIAALASCTPAGDRAADTLATDSASAAATAPVTATATAEVQDAAGNTLGNLIVTEVEGGVSLSGMLHGVTPGEHGIHIHAVGSCEGPDFASAGDHWNPDNRQHGTDNPDGPHAGDLANITVGADSMVSLQQVTPGGMLQGDSGLLDADGAAVVIHASADDYRTDPSGNSGDRIACGVLG